MAVSANFDHEPDRPLLLKHLAGQRQHVLGQLEGLNCGVASFHRAGAVLDWSDT